MDGWATLLSAFVGGVASSLIAPHINAKLAKEAANLQHRNAITQIREKERIVVISELCQKLIDLDGCAHNFDSVQSDITYNAFDTAANAFQKALDRAMPLVTRDVYQGLKAQKTELWKARNALAVGAMMKNSGGHLLISADEWLGLKDRFVKAMDELHRDGMDKLRPYLTP